MKSSLTISAVAAAVLCIPAFVQAQENPGKLSKQLLMKLSRDQSQVLCQSEVFTQCMGFEQQQCLELSEKALQKCFGPLPETIKLAELRNETLEACPQTVYSDAGFTEEKAQSCLQDAMK